MRLYIDDIRDPKNEYDFIARSSNSAIKWMESFGCPEFISFDHDLSGDDTAMRVVKWIVNRDLDCQGFIPDNFSFFVHSANSIGKSNIEGYLNSYLTQRKNNGL